MTSAIAISRFELLQSPLTVTSRRGSLDVIGPVSDEWRALAEEAVDDQPFYRPEWIQAHLRAFAPTSRVVLIEVRSGGRLCLLLPLIEERSTFSKVPIRKLRAPVNVHGGRFDALRRMGSEGDESIQAAANYLLELEGWDVLQLNNTPCQSTNEEIVLSMRGKGVRSLKLSDQPNPIILVPRDPSLLHSMPPNSKLRSQLRRVRQRLEKRGLLHFHRERDATTTDLERFYQLEANGWKGSAGSAILCNGTRPFYDEMARVAARFGYFSLFMLECNGELVAAHYSFTHQGRCYSPIVTYNEAFRQFAPGHLIISEILAFCAANGIRYFDITGQDQPWKMKWTSAARSMNHYFVFKGPIGQLAYRVGVSLRSAVGFSRQSQNDSANNEMVNNQ
jgi:CelD/BcsL family acetyltransferase involved in cellulose biosynthesis